MGGEVGRRPSLTEPGTSVPPVVGPGPHRSPLSSGDDGPRGPEVDMGPPEAVARVVAVRRETRLDEDGQDTRSTDGGPTVGVVTPVGRTEQPEVQGRIVHTGVDQDPLGSPPCEVKSWVLRFAWMTRHVHHQFLYKPLVGPGLGSRRWTVDTHSVQ